MCPTRGAPSCVTAPVSGTGTAERPPPPGPQQGEALLMQAAGYQVVLHGDAGDNRSHILAEGKWTISHGTSRQRTFAPQVDWQQAPTQAYNMAADPWPLAVLLDTISTRSRRQEEHLWATWQGDSFRTGDVPDFHAGPITRACPAATLAVAQRGQQNRKSVVCIFSPADAHIAICHLQRLPGPQATIRVAHCPRETVKALQEGDHHVLLLGACLKDHTRTAKLGVGPEAALLPADLELQLGVPTTMYHWLHAFSNLRQRGKPDRQISPTHWQEWLRADALQTPIRRLRPAPTARARDASAPGRTLVPQMVLLASLSFNPAPESSVRRSVTPLRQGGQRILQKALFVQTSSTHAGQ